MSTLIQITPSSGLTIGTTAITGGTVGRLLFEGSGNVVQESSYLTYDGLNALSIGNNTSGFIKTASENISGVSVGTLRTSSVNDFPLVKLSALFSSTYADGRVGLYRGNTEMIALQADSTGGYITGISHVNIGYGINSVSGARLDVKAQGALSTDIAFRVRNSANTNNIVEVRGNEIFYVNPTATFQANGINILNNSFNRLEHSVSLIWSGTSTTIGYGCSSNQDMRTGSIGGMPIYGIINWHDQNVQLGSTAALNGRGVFSIGTNTAPTTNMTDGFRMYSADIVAGNAAPHFRTEDGAVIKLYQQSSAGISTVGDIVTVLQNLGLLS